MNPRLLADDKLYVNCIENDSHDLLAIQLNPENCQIIHDSSTSSHREEYDLFTDRLSTSINYLAVASRCCHNHSSTIADYLFAACCYWMAVLMNSARQFNRYWTTDSLLSHIDHHRSAYYYCPPSCLVVVVVVVVHYICIYMTYICKNRRSMFLTAH